MLGLYYMPAFCYNAATKLQCINGLSYTHNNEFILNALLECALLVCIHTLYFKLPKMFYLSQLFINSMFAFLLQELDLHIICFHMLSTPNKLLINARIN